MLPFAGIDTWLKNANKIVFTLEEYKKYAHKNKNSFVLLTDIYALHTRLIAFSNLASCCDQRLPHFGTSLGHKHLGRCEMYGCVNVNPRWAPCARWPRESAVGLSMPLPNYANYGPDAVKVQRRLRVAKPPSPHLALCAIQLSKLAQ